MQATASLEECEQERACDGSHDRIAGAPREPSARTGSACPLALPTPRAEARVRLASRALGLARRAHIRLTQQRVSEHADERACRRGVELCVAVAQCQVQSV